MKWLSGVALRVCAFAMTTRPVSRTWQPCLGQGQGAVPRAVTTVSHMASRPGPGEASRAT